MLYALMGMRAENEHQERYHTDLTARIYEKYRIEHAEHHSKLMKSKNLVPWNKGGVEITDEHRENLRNAALTRNVDPIKQAEGQRKRLEKIIGQRRTDDTRKKMSDSHIGKLKGPMSAEEKLKRSLTQKGIPKVKTHGANVAKANIGNISINKDGIEKKVKQDTLQSYLDQGWQLGGKPRERK
jgi:hypothetical protein